MKKFTNRASGKAFMLCVFVLFGISTVFATNYSVAVMGAVVTSDNCNDILNDGGSVKYDDATKTLTLNNANINYDGVDAINFYAAKMTLKLIGNNSIVATKGNGISFDYGNCTISSNNNTPCSLNIDAGTSGIYSEGDLLVNPDITITIRANVFGMSLAGSSLQIYGSSLDVQGNDGSIVGVSYFYMSAEFLSNHTYDETSHKFLDASGKEAADHILIGKDHKLKIAGTKVTSLNENDVFGDGGSVIFKKQNTTLYLNNATIKSPKGEDGIFYQEEGAFKNGLNVAMSGDNTISVQNGESPVAAIKSLKGLTLDCQKSDAILTLEGWGDGFAYGISTTGVGCSAYGKDDTSSHGYSLTININNPQIAAFAGWLFEETQLHLNNVNINITGKNMTLGAIAQTTSLTMTDCVFASPQTATFSEDKKAVVDAEDNIINGNLNIEQRWTYMLKNGDVLCYSSDEMTGAISSKVAAYWALRFPAQYLKGRKAVEKLQMYINEGDTYTMYIRQTEPNATNPGSSSICEKEYTFETLKDWTDLNLDAPVAIDENKDLWIVMHIATPEVFGAAFGGRFNCPYGSYLSSDGQNWTNRYFDRDDENNWMIRVFTTNSTLAVETVDNAQCTMHKYIRDGQLYIEKDGRTFNVLGTEVR